MSLCELGNRKLSDFVRRYSLLFRILCPHHILYVRLVDDCFGIDEYSECVASYFVYYNLSSVIAWRWRVLMLKRTRYGMRMVLSKVKLLRTRKSCEIGSHESFFNGWSFLSGIFWTSIALMLMFEWLLFLSWSERKWMDWTELCEFVMFENWKDELTKASDSYETNSTHHSPTVTYPTQTIKPASMTHNNSPTGSNTSSVTATLILE